MTAYDYPNTGNSPATPQDAGTLVPPCYSRAGRSRPPSPASPSCYCPVAKGAPSAWQFLAPGPRDPATWSQRHRSGYQRSFSLTILDHSLTIINHHVLLAPSGCFTVVFIKFRWGFSYSAFSIDKEEIRHSPSFQTFHLLNRQHWHGFSQSSPSQ